MTSSPYTLVFHIFKIGCLWSIVSIHILKILYYKIKRQLQRRWVPWRGKKLKLRKSCMEGTHNDILQAIETEVKNTGGHNMIWIRESPGVEKSALAISISTQLQDQNRHVSKIIWDFPRLLKGVGMSRIGEEEGIYYTFLPFIQ